MKVPGVGSTSAAERDLLCPQPLIDILQCGGWNLLDVFPSSGRRRPPVYRHFNFEFTGFTVGPTNPRPLLKRPRSLTKHTAATSRCQRVARGARTGGRIRRATKAPLKKDGTPPATAGGGDGILRSKSNNGLSSTAARSGVNAPREVLCCQFAMPQIALNSRWTTPLRFLAIPCQPAKRSARQCYPKFSYRASG